MKHIISLSLIFFITACNQVENTFVWGSESKTSKGTFDPKLYTIKQIHDTHELCNAHYGGYAKLGFYDNGKMSEPTGVLGKTNDDLEKEYLEKKKKIEALQPVNESYWLDLKNQKLIELTDEYEIKKITLESINNPSILENNKFSYLCPDQIKKINQKDTLQLIKNWDTLMVYFKGFDEQQITNYIHFFNTTNKTQKNKFIAARTDLIIHGWWFCTVEKLSGQIKTRPIDKFDELFTKIESEEN